VGTFFFYLGIQKTNIPSALFPVLLVLGAGITAYHSYKALKYFNKGINPWFNIIHILLIGPILMYIGYQKNKTPNYVFELILMLAFASIGYHGYYLYKESFP
jgi:hypothetical protein